MTHMYLKTIDGDEVFEFEKDLFDKIIKSIEFKKIKRHDRTLYLVKKDTKCCHINFLQDDYIE